MKNTFSELKQYAIDFESIKLLNYNYCIKNLVVVLGKVDPLGKEPITIGCINPSDNKLLAEVEGLLCRDILPVQLNDYEIKEALHAAYYKDGATASDRLCLSPVSELTFFPLTQVSALLNEILGMAVTKNATDIHIETYENDVDVRLRIDGTLRSISTALDPENIDSAICRLKILANLDITEKRRSQDGRIMAVYDANKQQRKIDFRLSVVPGPFGEDAVMRILDSSNPSVGLERLGFSQDIMLKFKKIISNPEGLILVTGPTGSGKTTTLYSALEEINATDNKILTVEDPIEYTFDKINQKQITSTMDYADYARCFMRQNPDIILIGEIRDEETADAALRAAQTGHLVLSTLHTNDAVSTISRLMTLKIDSGLIASSLLGALSQRLVKKVCEHCKREVPPSDREKDILKTLLVKPHYFKGEGCDRCNHSGFKGRIGVYELFVPDEELTDMIATSQPVHIIRKTAVEKGMTTLVADAIEKAASGITSLSEILRVIPYRIIQAELTEQKH